MLIHLEEESEAVIAAGADLVDRLGWRRAAESAVAMAISPIIGRTRRLFWRDVAEAISDAMPWEEA